MITVIFRAETRHGYLSSFRSNLSFILVLSVLSFPRKGRVVIVNPTSAITRVVSGTDSKTLWPRPKPVRLVRP